MAAPVPRIVDRPWSLAVGIVGATLGLPMLLVGMLATGDNPRWAETGTVAAIVGAVLTTIGFAGMLRTRPLRLDKSRRALVRGHSKVHDLSQATTVALWHGSLDDATGCVLVINGRDAAGRELHERLMARQEDAAAIVSAATVSPIPHILRVGTMQRTTKARRLADELARELGTPLVRLSGPRFAND